MDPEDLNGVFEEPGQTDPAAEGQVEVPEVPELPEPNLSPFAQNYLNRVPEQERPLVKRHVSEWDKGFNQYAQGVQGELKKWREFGELEEVAQAVGLLKQFRDDPAYVAKVLVEQGFYTPETPGTPPANGNQPQQQEDAPWKPELTKLQQENQRMQRALGMVGEHIQGERQRKEQEAAEAQLDSYLSSFKETYKGVPDRWILTCLNSGMMDPEEIAREWQNEVRQYVRPAGNTKQPPNVMGAGSQPPVAPNVAEMSEAQRKEALMSRIFG